MPTLPSPINFVTGPGNNVPRNLPYPIDGSNERIARLRSELQGVRTGIQRIVSGLQDLNETTRQQEIAAEATSFTMPPRSEIQASSRDTRSVFQGNLEASAWSPTNAPAIPRVNGATIPRHGQSLDATNTAPGEVRPPLRYRQRAWLETDDQRQARTPPNITTDPTSRNINRRPMRDNPFQALGSREEVERPDYQSPVASMYGSAWGEYRNAEAARQGQNLGISTTASTAENQQPVLPNPLMSPADAPQFATPYFARPIVGASQPYVGPIGLQAYSPPEPYFAPPMRFAGRDAVNGLGPRWTFRPSASTASNRRQQNLSAPDQGVGHSENTPSIRRMSGAARRAANRGESDGGAFGRPLDMAGIDMMQARFGYPYMPPGLSRGDYLAGYAGRDIGSDTESEPPLTFDTQNRPPPMDADAMMLDMSCSICKEHIVDTVVLPCGHAVMCNWCADLHAPSSKKDKSVPKDRSAKCPMCRTRIKQKVRIICHYWQSQR
jgi:Zinc finger, C3HC4 type (RING finger)